MNNVAVSDEHTYHYFYATQGCSQTADEFLNLPLLALPRNTQLGCSRCILGSVVHTAVRRVSPVSPSDYASYNSLGESAIGLRAVSKPTAKEEERGKKI